MKNVPNQSVANDAPKKEKAITNKAQKQVVDGLCDLFLEGLKDVYWSEKALLRAMPKMIKNATSDALTSTLLRHSEMEQGHITQLESVFCAIDEKAKSKKCPLMSSLIREAEKAMNNAEKGMVCDAAIVSANRKIRHHEMATYSVLHSLAITLLEHDAAVLLRQNFEEEKEADEQLAVIATSFFQADITLTNKDISTKKTKGLATNKAVVNHQNGVNTDVLEAYLSEREALEMKTIRIIEVQFKPQNDGDLTTLTESVPTGPLSININLGAFSKRSKKIKDNAKRNKIGAKIGR